MAIEFEFDSISKEMLTGIVAVTAASGYKSQDLRITATVGGVTLEGSLNTGRVKFEVSGKQSNAEFEVNAVVTSPGQVVTNSYYLSQLPDQDVARWKCKEIKNKLKITAPKHKYDFTLGELEAYQYDPMYGDTPIDISGLSDKLPILSSVLAGFVTRKLNDSLDGSVKMSGEKSTVFFEATNNNDAIFGQVDVPVAISQPWEVILPIAQFESWKKLPIKDNSLLIGVDSNYQINIKCGPIKIIQNTLTNLIDSMEPVRSYAEGFLQMAVDGTDAKKSVTFECKYVPEKLHEKVSEVTIYADGDPNIKLIGKGDELVAKVNTASVDSDATLSRNIDIILAGEANINRKSLGLVDKVRHLSTIKMDELNPDSWLIMRCTDVIIYVASADNKFIAMTSQVAI